MTPPAKQKNKGSGVAGKDSFQRINYLYQMATLMSHQQNPKLSSYYGRMCRLVGQKSVLRIEPEMKRKICKTCKTILIPGVSAQLSISVGNSKVCQIKCNNCQSEKRFHINPAYKMWLDDPNSIVDTLTPSVTTTTTTQDTSHKVCTPPLPMQESIELMQPLHENNKTK